MAIGRVIRPEILDGLAADDPRARRSRRDLRMINALQGNPGWMRRQLARRNVSRIVEMGAGDGILARRLAGWLPGATITALDLAEGPEDLPEGVTWVRGDLFQTLREARGEAVIGSMIVHHFSDEALGALGQAVEDSGARVLCLCEPWRSGVSHFLGRLMHPIVSEVTRHDMPVSIDAGFVRGELAGRLNLRGWKFEESVHGRGVLRLVAWRE